MAGLGKQGAARRGGGQLSVLLPVSLPSDKQTQTGANGGTLPLAQESHGSMSVNNVPLPEGHVEHNVELRCIVRKHAPLQVTKWAKIDKADRESLLQMAKFEEQLISGEEPYQEHVPDEVFESMEIDEMPSLERDDMIPLGCTDVDNIFHEQPMENVDEEDNNFINESDIEEDYWSDDIHKDDTFSNDECESD
ncbi:unnamed protein product [Ilex paraguariensis]|uniref:Uncharacterized protein n=1 Tax=Ilex paraguariensis TaxID=185542 RepID=A0ABC8TVG6_9AQUA